MEQSQSNKLELHTLYRREEIQFKYADNLIAVDNHISKEYIETGKFVGAITGVLSGENVVHCSPLGLMDMERNKSLERDTIFRIYSMT